MPARSSPRATEPRPSPPGGLGRALVGACLALASAALLGACGDGDGDGTTAERDGATTKSADGQGTLPTGSGRGGVKLTEIGSFSDPVFLTQPEDAGRDLYIVEQEGRVVRRAPDGATSTFLDISDEVSSGGEMGLLSIAFAPDYAESGLFYVDYTDSEGDTRVVEYRADGGTVDAGSGRELLRVEQPYENHNGGLLLFGPDGKLYIGLGDGGGSGDPERRGLDLSTLLGKILRIDPQPNGSRPYTIPRNNPFVDEPGARPEIFAYGLRNPWRFSFDAADDDELTIADVGQDVEEEIDVVSTDVAPGANFGWSAYEGNQRFNDDQRAPEAIAPVLTATHGDGNCSITGGLTVRDPDLPTLYGRYVWGDLCLGELQSFTPEPDGPADDNLPLDLEVEQLSSFGEDAAGHVYAISLEGPVYRLDPVSSEPEP